jgi:hypothetical protein
LGEPERADERLQELLSDGQMVPTGIVTLLGIANLMLGDTAEAIELFERVVDRLRRAWPSRQKMPVTYWELLTTVVPDTETQDRVRGYFESDNGGTG